MTMQLWCVQATVTRYSNGAGTTSQIPTFFLDGNIQGITDAKHCERIAVEIVNHTGNPNVHVSAYCWPVGECQRVL